MNNEINFLNDIAQLKKSLKTQGKYDAVLKEIVEQLNRTQEILFNSAVYLALTGVWQEWEKTIPVGTTVTFYEEMLLETGDSTIDKIMELRKKVTDVINSIPSTAS